MGLEGTAACDDNSGAEARMRYFSNNGLLVVIVALGLGLFTLDRYLPLGIGNGVLYGGLVILSFFLKQRNGPLVTASLCTVLTMADVMLSPPREVVPFWVGITNRLFSLTAIWLPLLFFLHRRRAEEALRMAYEKLDARVRERTQELAALNEALVAEIDERMETERSLRGSEAVLQSSQEELRRSREDLRALAGQLLNAQEEDRRRISRDLHDDINQRLAMLSMDLRQLEKRPPDDAEGMRASIRSMTGRLTSLSDDVRQMAYRFHPSILDDLGLVKAIRRLVDDYATRTGLETSYIHQDPTVPLPAELSTCLYRVVQEGLSNVSRHARASRVEVELICEDEHVSLSIRDNGQGFDAATLQKTGGHLGLLSMHERVRLAKGRL
ncbi:MAG TPA: sensor histidine kinase, partial [Nitrospira sp.]